jgi:hypothetical protein
VEFVMEMEELQCEKQTNGEEERTMEDHTTWRPEAPLNTVPARRTLVHLRSWKLRY